MKIVADVLPVYEPLSVVLRSVIQKIVFLAPNCIFTGRVSLEAFNVIALSIQPPHDVDVMYESVTQLRCLPNLVEHSVCPSTGKWADKPSTIIEDITVDFFQTNYNDYCSGDVVKFNMFGTVISILHPKYAVQAKVGYIKDICDAICKNSDNVSAEQLARFRKHASDIFDFSCCISDFDV